MAPNVAASVQTIEISAAVAKVANKPRQPGASCMISKRSGTKTQVLGSMENKRTTLGNGINDSVFEKPTSDAE
jgi:hypothetical protein